jgi:hypothetical protein
LGNNDQFLAVFHGKADRIPRFLVHEHLVEFPGRLFPGVVFQILGREGIFSVEVSYSAQRVGNHSADFSDGGNSPNAIIVTGHLEDKQGAAGGKEGEDHLTFRHGLTNRLDIHGAGKGPVGPVASDSHPPEKSFLCGAGFRDVRELSRHHFQVFWIVGDQGVPFQLISHQGDLPVQFAVEGILTQQYFALEDWIVRKAW